MGWSDQGSIGAFWLRYKPLLGFGIALLIALAIFIWPRYVTVEANRCFALLMFVVVMWITEALPLFASSLMIPPLAVLLNLLRDEGGEALPANQAASRLLSVMFQGTIPVLLASFTIAACYIKYKISFPNDGRLVQILTKDISLLLLGLMGLTLILCVGMSNLSAVLLSYTLLRGPLQRDHLSSDTAKAILMAIVVAGSIGGFISPVSSAQNVLCYSFLQDQGHQVSWWKWMRITLPCAIICLLLGWITLLVVYQPKNIRPIVLEDGQKVQEETGGRPLTRTKLFLILFITFATIVLWSTSNVTLSVLGGMPTISFITIVSLFASGILDAEDLKILPWDIVLLVMGALALVEASRSSGLLSEMTEHLELMLTTMHSWTQLASLSLFLLVVSTLKSHTVAGLIFLPLIASYVGQQPEGFDEGASLLLAAVMSTSLGMAFPFSALVNLTMLTVTDGDGNRILSARDFFKVGLPVSLLSYLVIIILVPIL